MSRITVLGSGAWGTAIALALEGKQCHKVTLWAHNEAEADEIRQAGENRHFLPGFPLPASLAVTADELAVADAEILVSVIPSEFLRPTIARLAPHTHPGQVLVSATKGIEDGTFLSMTEVIRECLREAKLGDDPGTMPVGAFSGPSFALEVAQGMPTAVTIAFAEPGVASMVQREFSSSSLRLYSTDDVIGVELGGAVKNVIAIAAGVASGLGLGFNSAAALMTRGIAEITRLAVAAGGRRETLNGLSGIGDLVLTCTGSLSRNRTVGAELGRGRKLPEILLALDGKVAEGVRTTRAALGLARKLGVEMPITEQMELILDEGKDPKTAIKELMLRPGREEVD
jgi:glycerol-3-phosphate dehydrogenase (NAD(P)+)